MPDRIIRDELLESTKWLSLKDNADRLAYVALLLKADSLGNFSAEPQRLVRMWRDFGITTPELVAKTLMELSESDLIRLYEADGKTLLHIPRYRQRLRYLKRVFPISPWTTDEEKQRLEIKSPDSRLSVTGLSPDEVKRSEEKKGVEVSKYPTRQRQTVLVKQMPAKQEPNPDQIEKNRRIAQAQLSGDIELAKRIKEGIA